MTNKKEWPLNVTPIPKEHPSTEGKNGSERIGNYNVSGSCQRPHRWANSADMQRTKQALAKWTTTTQEAEWDIFCKQYNQGLWNKPAPISSIQKLKACGKEHTYLEERKEKCLFRAEWMQFPKPRWTEGEYTSDYGNSRRDDVNRAV